VKLVVVTGTGTDVGKTWVGCALLGLARSRGLRVAARKPLQSHAPGDRSTDGAALAAASGEPVETVGPAGWTYPVPMAPPMAGEVLGRPVPSLAELAGWLQTSWPTEGCDLALVEGAGGAASPLAADGDSADLARAIGADGAVLVAEPGLGVIHSVRLSVRALAPVPAVVHLNRFDPTDPLHGRNLQWLRGRDGLDVTTDVGELLDRVLG
jgi:dethiobiotin synthetase